MKFCLSVFFVFLPIFSFAALQDVLLEDEIESLSWVNVLKNCRSNEADMAADMLDTVFDVTAEMSGIDNPLEVMRFCIVPKVRRVRNRLSSVEEHLDKEGVAVNNEARLALDTNIFKI